MAPGFRIDDKYRIEGTLGTGGTAIVFSATQEDLQRLVAIKVIRQELIEHPDAVNRLMSEATTVAQIKGEHAARILDIGQLENGCPYIVMEHLEGNDFASLLEEHGPAPFERVVDWVLQASVAIAEAHSLGIIHRDLKPQNLYLANTPKGEPVVKVLDFGISTTTTSRLPTKGANTGEFKRIDGSPYYMSPEQMQALPEDVRSDIWGLGVLMFELLTNELPFPGDSFDEIYNNALHAAAPLYQITNAPQSLIQVIHRCLQKKPEERYADMAEFARALEPLASVEGKLCVTAIERILNGKARPKSAEAWSRRVAPAPRTETMKHDDSTADPTPASVETVKWRGFPWLATLAGCGVLTVAAFLFLAKDEVPAPEDVTTVTLPLQHAEAPGHHDGPGSTTSTSPASATGRAASDSPASDASPVGGTVNAVSPAAAPVPVAPPKGPAPTKAQRPDGSQLGTPPRATAKSSAPLAPRPKAEQDSAAASTPKPSSTAKPAPIRPDDPNWAWKRDAFGSRK